MISMRMRIHRRTLLDAMLVAGACLVVGLGLANIAREPLASNEAGVLQSGEELPELEFVTVSGYDSSTLRLPNSDPRPLLIILFSGTCPACEQNATAWQTLVHNAVRNGAWTVAITPDPPVIAQEWLATNKIEIETLAWLHRPDQLIRQWRVANVPTTILVFGTRVLRASSGTLAKEQIDSIWARIDSAGRREGPG